MKGFLFLISCSLLSVIGLMGSPAANAQNNQPPLWDNGIGHRSWSIALEPEDEKKMLLLWNSIGEDLKTETNDLAGTYILKGNSGFFLRWSVRKGFVVIPYFDQNLITDYGYGTVTFVDNSEVNFTPEKQLRGGRGLGEMRLRWAAIWGHFFPVDSLSDFADYRAGLGDYNEFIGPCCEFVPSFLTDRVDRPGIPIPVDVPAKYKHFIKNPITAQITSVGKKKRVKDLWLSGALSGSLIEKAVLIPVRIDVGRVQGVKRNMLFRIIGDPVMAGRYVQIMKVGPRTSSGFAVYEASENEKEDTYRDETDQEKPLPAIRVGARATTRPRD